MTDKQYRNLVEDAAARLGEHFDAVQILASRPLDGGGTACTKSGVGNWYARQGMAQEFITQDQAQELSTQIAERMNPPDDGDQWKIET